MLHSKMNMFLFLLFAFLSVVSALPLRRVRDYLGDVWEEYFDETTQHFYYHNPVSRSTSWILEFSPRAEFSPGSSNNKKKKSSFTRSSNPWDSIPDSFIGDTASTRRKGGDPIGKMPLYPEDRDKLHLLQDPAGQLRTRHIFTVFDALRGIKARINYPIALKAPVAFHHMFMGGSNQYQGGLGESVVGQERRRVEALLLEGPEASEVWESLGHIWRVYGDVERTIDCYRRALEIGPAEKPSLYINLAGVLDQMNFIRDAMQILQTMMDSVDVFSAETEANVALGYIMAAQLQVRDKNFTLAKELLDTAIELQPQFYAAVMGLQQEIHYRSTSFGGPPWFLGGSGSWAYEKDPWLFFSRMSWILRAIHLESVVTIAENVANTHPRISLLLRKGINTLPAIMAGLLARKTAVSGPMIKIFGLTVPTVIPMCLLVVATSLTEFLVLECIFFIIIGVLVGHEKFVEKRLFGN